MKKEGPQPKRRNSSELINAMIYKGSAQGRADVWSIVAETQEAGVKQNYVTDATLLKCYDANSKEQNIERTMNLVSSMDEPMNQVLLASLVEADARGIRVLGGVKSSELEWH